MSQETERPIEKLLRAFAKKHRDAAGTSFELHPATRRLLQAEVARQCRKQGAALHPYMRFAGRLWPRLAWGLAGATMLLFGLWLLFPQSGRKRPETLLAKNEPIPSISPIPKRSLKQEAWPALPSLKPEFRPDQQKLELKEADARKDGAILPDSESAQAEAGTLPGEKRLAGTDGQSPAAAPVGAIAGINNQEPIPSRVAQADASQAETGTENIPTTSAPAVNNVGLPSQQVAGGGSALLAKTTSQFPRQHNGASDTNAIFRASFATAPEVRRRMTMGQRWAPSSSNLKTKPGSAGGTLADNAILASFQFEQSGQGLRVIDNDGSIYSGSLQTSSAGSVPIPVFSSSGVSRDPARRPEAQLADQLAKPVSTTEEYFFNVTGTNRSLKQRVFFSGKLVEATNAPAFLPVAGVSQVSAVENSRSQVPSSDSQFLNKRILGKAIIGESTEITIDASPIMSAYPEGKNQR